MRILPLAFYLENSDTFEQFTITHQISCLTHKHLRSQMACGIYIQFAIDLLRGYSLLEAYENMKNIGDFVNKVKQVINRGLPKYLEKDFIFVWKTANPYVYEEGEKPPLDKALMDFSNCRKMVKYILKNLEIEMD
jgi:hypothetical protein